VRYRVRHSTRYTYAEAIPLSHNLIRLRPRDRAVQTCLRHSLTIHPTPAVSSERFDYFGNDVVWFSLQEPHSELTITAKSDVEVSLGLRPDISQGSCWEQVLETIRSAPDAETIFARQFAFDSPYVPRSAELAAYAEASFITGRPFLECVLDLTQRIHKDFQFLPGSTKVETPVAEVLRTRRGVCQDFAHLEIGCLRSLGFSTRYVSGYIVTTPPPGKERLVGADVSHAWISVFSPDFGWMDFDPTNGVIPSDTHVTVAWARDYDDVGPVRGILIGGQRQKLEVSVDVVPIEPSALDSARQS
jgi:transglutaminase-like putative cysteine protease